MPSGAVPTNIRPEDSSDVITQQQNYLCKINSSGCKTSLAGSKTRQSLVRRGVVCSASTSQAARPDTEKAECSGRGIEYTSYEANSWAVLFRNSGVSCTSPDIWSWPRAAVAVGMLCFASLTSTMWLPAGVRLLVDPWLVEELTFGGQSWLYRGKKTHIDPVDPDTLAKECDAVVLSQVHCPSPL